MHLRVFQETKDLARAAAAQAASAIRDAIQQRGSARMVAATGASQFEFLDALTARTEMDWSKVELFHLDEYIGIPMTHPASFCKYLQERIIDKTGIVLHHLLDGARAPLEVIRDASKAINTAPIDVAFAGIGENSHLAFNDPPAKFDADEAYIIVDLDESCRRQQVGEGWFREFSSVPAQAISMSIRQIMKSRTIISVVPEQRKAQAVRACLEGPVSPLAPASILRTHPDATIYLDMQSASLLGSATLSALAAS